jgi:hypothetical protein
VCPCLQLFGNVSYSLYSNNNNNNNNREQIPEADIDIFPGIWEKKIETFIVFKCRCLFDPGTRDPGWVKKSGSGSGMNNPDYFRELGNNFWGLKYLNALMADPGWEKFGSEINIANPQHFLFAGC